MKTALIFHGHLRSFRKTHSFFEKNVSSHIENNLGSLDVFIHTWSEEEFLTKTWHEGVQESSPTNPHDVEELYRPKKLKIEDQPEINPHICAFGRPIEALKAPWQSFSSAWNLMEEQEKEDKEKYDLVIVSRPDVQHFTPLFLDELRQTDYFWQCQIFTKLGASDVLLFGGRDQISQINLFAENFDKMHSKEIITKYSNNEFVFNDFMRQIANVRKSQYCMPRDWRLLRTNWDPDHHVGHRKWDKDLASKDIDEMDRFEFFRRKNDRS